MKNFSTVQEHFRKLRCSHCEARFSPEGIKLLREEKDYWVVRVHCTACDQPSGVAVVGVEFEGGEKMNQEPNPQEFTARVTRRATFQTKAEEKKFQAMPPISADDMLNAHSFFQSLGADWAKHLPGT
jgi:hypothetical protein